MLICYAIIYLNNFLNFSQKTIDIHIVSLFSVSHYTIILLFLQLYIKGLGMKSHYIEFDGVQNLQSPNSMLTYSKQKWNLDEIFGVPNSVLANTQKVLLIQ